MITYQNVHIGFRSAMVDAGIVTDAEIIADGKLHRIYIEGDKHGTKNGAYILHADGTPSGWFQHFRTGITGKWSASGKREPMTAAMRQQINADRHNRRLELALQHKSAAKTANWIMETSKPVKSHPYLIRKHIQPHGARLYKGALVIPIYDEAGKLVNLQFIASDGTKRFLSGGKKKSCFAHIGKHADDQPIVICEGWATGASLHEHTGHFVIVALDVGNLEPVAKVIRGFYPSAAIVIAGDNDLSGVGQKAARAAALAVGGKYIIPATPGHDWNDSLTMEVV